MPISLFYGPALFYGEHTHISVMEYWRWWVVHLWVEDVYKRQKGETSGNFLHVVDMSLDCDQDALLILVAPVGPTCHTGEDSCFHQFTQQGTSHWTWFAQLKQYLAEKKNADPTSSYTATLHSKGTVSYTHLTFPC